MFGIVKRALFWQQLAINCVVPSPTFLWLMHVAVEIVAFQILSTSLPHYLDMDGMASKG